MPARTVLVAACFTAFSFGLAVPAHAATPIQFGKIHYDSPGSDSSANTSVNGEYLVIKNTGTTARSLTGWTVRDAQNHVYRFGTLTLAAGKSVVLRTGKGTNSTSTRYWGSGYHVWNITGDTASLRTAAGVASDTCAWTTKGAGYQSC